MVVSEARVGAGLEQRLHRRDVPAQCCVVQGRPAHLIEIEKEKEKKGVKERLKKMRDR